MRSLFDSNVDKLMGSEIVFIVCFWQDLLLRQCIYSYVTEFQRVGNWSKFMAKRNILQCKKIYEFLSTLCCTLEVPDTQSVD